MVLLRDLVCGDDELFDPDEAADKAAALNLLVDGSLKHDLDEAAALDLLVDGSLEHDLLPPFCFKLGFSIGEAGITAYSCSCSEQKCVTCTCTR